VPLLEPTSLGATGSLRLAIPELARSRMLGAGHYYADFNAGLPAKSKGVHWQTYEREIVRVEALLAQTPWPVASFASSGIRVLSSDLALSWSRNVERVA
jgi:hypothetical protein